MTEDLNSWWPVPLVAAVATVVAVPLIIVIDSLLDKPEKGLVSGSRLKQESAVGDDIKDILVKMDPIDSLYFDVSVARHLLEEGDSTRAREWLDPNALGELKKSYQAGFLTPIEFDKIGEDIVKIGQAINGGKTVEAMTIIVPLQQMLAEKAYTTFKELDPIPDGYLDGRYEAAREKKVVEWRAKGYDEGLIEKALKWSDEWSRGIAAFIFKDPTMRKSAEELIYPRGLEHSERWIEAMAK